MLRLLIQSSIFALLLISLPPLTFAPSLFCSFFPIFCFFNVYLQTYRDELFNCVLRQKFGKTLEQRYSYLVLKTSISCKFLRKKFKYLFPFTLTLPFLFMHSSIILYFLYYSLTGVYSNNISERKIHIAGRLKLSLCSGFEFLYIIDTITQIHFFWLF